MDEPLVGKGLAATLALLKSKGMIERATEEQLKKEKDQRDRLRWLAEQKARSLTRDKSQKDPEKARPPETCGGRQQRRRASLTGEKGWFSWRGCRCCTAGQVVHGRHVGARDYEAVRELQAGRQHHLRRRVWPQPDPQGGPCLAAALFDRDAC